MACHLDGGICPHDYPGSSRGGYLGGGSSSYAGSVNYAGLQTYNPLGKMSGQYNGSGNGTAAYNPLLAGNSLAAYATNPKYDAAYTAAGNYASQSASKNNATPVGRKKEPAVGAYNGNRTQQQENSERNQEQQFVARDDARPVATIDDTLDEKNAVAVQRNFLEQMIRNARQLTNAQQPQYVAMYQ